MHNIAGMISNNNFSPNKLSALPPRGFSLLGVLVCLLIFSISLVSFSYWATTQNQRLLRIYHYRHMLRIAENQSQRQLLNLECESKVRSNGMDFFITCTSEQIVIRGKIGNFVLSLK